MLEYCIYIQYKYPMNANLDTLLQLPNTWQASRGPRPGAGIASGYEALDQALHQRGWPPGATTELLLEQAGIGELGLLLPALRARQSTAGWLVLIAPPWQPFAPAWQQAGIDLQRLLILQPRNLRELLWSTDQCLTSGNCSAVLTWALGQHILDRDLRRLQHAAANGNCWHILLRHSSTHQQSSPAALRLQLQPAAGGQLQLHILKQRGGWSGQTLALHPCSQPQPQPAQQPVYLGRLPSRSSLGGDGHPAGSDSRRVTALAGYAAARPSA